MRYRTAAKITACVFYSVVLAGALVLWKFPYHSLEERLQAVARQRWDLGLEIEKLAPGFPLGLKFGRCAVHSSESPGELLLVAKEGYLRPRLICLFEGNLGALFGARLYGGFLRGEIQLRPPFAPRRCHLKVSWEGVRSGEQRALANLLGRRLDGKMSGELELHGSLENLASFIGGGELRLREGSCPIRSPFLKVDRLANLEVTAGVRLNHTEVQISRCRFKAPGLEGSLAGVFRLGNSLPASVVDLKGQGRIDPGLMNLANATGKGALTFLQQHRQVPFRVQGSLGAPRLRLF